MFAFVSSENIQLPPRSIAQITYNLAETLRVMLTRERESNFSLKVPERRNYINVSLLFLNIDEMSIASLTWLPRFSNILNKNTMRLLQ
jgi:hypothetical protein